MPNHTTNVMTLRAKTAAVLEAFLAEHWKPEGSADDAAALDFNSIIAMPHSIKNTVSGSDSDTSLAFAIAETLEIADEVPLLHKSTGAYRSTASDLRLKWAHGQIGSDIERGADEWKLAWESAKAASEALTDRELLTWAHAQLAENPTLADIGRTMLSNMSEHGATNWYDWSLKYWGTKWNAYHGHIRQEVASLGDEFELVLEFSTAWSPPEPVYAHLAKLYADELEFDVIGYDEGWCWSFRTTKAYGEDFISDETHSDFDPLNDDASAELYAQVHGEPALQSLIEENRGEPVH